ncbi:hypothetical protein P3342_002522 [Pyrenophora teres f. teres]|nr:hypothetical protein P3342_002522 [Pyrenophora teres f. teres]
MVWDDHKSKGDHDGAIWRPKAPDGYVALGDICINSYSTPPTNLMWCVRSDLVMDSDFEPASVWDDKGSGATLYSTIWAVARPAIGIKGFEKLPVFVDTFRSDDNPNRTIPPASLAKVLTLPCPNDFTEFDPEVPKVTKDKIPVEGDTFSEMSQAQLTLPFTAFFSPDDRSCLNNISDPFVTLSKRSAWIVASAHVNDSRGQITLKTKVMRGVSKSQSEEITHSAGVEVSASYGIGGFSMGVSLNYQFTLKDSSTYTEYQESTREQTYTIPEYHATVFFIRHMWLKAHRSNGTSELCEISFNANEDIHLVGVDLDRPS